MSVVTSLVARYAPEAQITLYNKGMDANTMNEAPYDLLLDSFMAVSIYKAVQDGHDVINISAGLGNDFAYLKLACRYAYDNNVVIFTTSPYYLGKLGLNPIFSVRYETTVSVTGIKGRTDGTYDCWQAAAPEVTTTVSAPNAPFIAYQTYVDQKDEYDPGISCATPIVTSLIALTISVYPKLGIEPSGEYFESIKRILIKNANPKVFRVFCQKAAMALLVESRK